MNDCSPPSSRLPIHGSVGGKRRERIYQILKEHALHYDFKPGQHLSIIQLADQLKVSNTPVREALMRLYAEGLVAAIPARGFFGRELRLREMVDLHDTASVLLSYCLQRANLPDCAKEISEDSPLAMLRRSRRTRPLILARESETLFKGMARAYGNRVILRTIIGFCEQTHHIRLCDFERPKRGRHSQRALSRLTAALRRDDREDAQAGLDEYFQAVIRALPELVMHALATSLSAAPDDSFAQGVDTFEPKTY